MNTVKRFTLATLAAAVVIMPLGAGVATAQEAGTTDPQSPTQAFSAARATLETASAGLIDALNGEDRPDGAAGNEVERPPLTPQDLLGPFEGLLNGPFD